MTACVGEIRLEGTLFAFVCFVYDFFALHSCIHTFMHYHNAWIHVDTCTIIIGNPHSLSRLQFGWRREKGRLVKFDMEGSSELVRMDDVDMLVNERIIEYIQNNLGQLLQAVKETGNQTLRPSYRVVPPPTQREMNPNDEEDVVVDDGPPLIEDKVKAYEA